MNNADRKAGHCLLGTDGRIWAIDHGLTFSIEPKLRTVLWDYAGEPVPEPLLKDLDCLRTTWRAGRDCELNWRPTWTRRRSRCSSGGSIESCGPGGTPVPSPPGETYPGLWSSPSCAAYNGR